MSKRKKPPIVVFRTTEAHVKKLQEMFEAQPPLGVHSRHHLARKWVEDVLSGRAELHYADGDQVLRDCERSIGAASSDSED